MKHLGESGELVVKTMWEKKGRERTDDVNEDNDAGKRLKVTVVDLPNWKKKLRNVLWAEIHSVVSLSTCASGNDHGNDYALSKCLSLLEYRE